MGGLQACDESTGTIGTRLEANGMENSEANRQKWRNLLFTTPGINQYVSGAILFEETLFQNDPDGKPFVDVMKGLNIIPGIKVDTGLIPLYNGGPGEKWCRGLDSLAERCEKYYEQGARARASARSSAWCPSSSPRSSSTARTTSPPPRASRSGCSPPFMPSCRTTASSWRDPCSSLR